MRYRSGVTRGAALIGLAAAGLILACSSKELRYPADHARFQRIDAAVEALRKAYMDKDASGIQALLLPLDPLERLTAEIEKDFQQFEDISVEFSIERIVIDGETIDVFIHWQGQWKRTAEDSGVRERGHGVLRWVGVQSILLKGVEGDLPFGMAARRPAPGPVRGGVS